MVQTCLTVEACIFKIRFYQAPGIAGYERLNLSSGVFMLVCLMHVNNKNWTGPGLVCPHEHPFVHTYAYKYIYVVQFISNQHTKASIQVTGQIKLDLLCIKIQKSLGITFCQTVILLCFLWTCTPIYTCAYMHHLSPSAQIFLSSQAHHARGGKRQTFWKC